MMTIPDAPYIREAETVGMPSPKQVECPECGNTCETIYRNRFGEVIGCDHCIEHQDACDWWEEEQLALRPEWDSE